MREMKDSGTLWIGKIPKEWGIKKFKYYFSIIGGNGFKEIFQGQQNGDIPFCKASDINGTNKYVNSAKNYVTKELAEQEKYNIIQPNSILIAKIGEALKKNHRKINTISCIVDNNCEAFILKENDDINYLYYLMCIIDMIWFDNGGTIPSVNNEKLKNFFLPNPCTICQQKISSYLDTKCTKIDSIIEKQEKVIEKLKAYKLSVITEAVTKGLNPDVKMKDSGVEWIGEIPEHWEYAKLNNICTFHNGDRSSNYPSPADFVDEGIPFIGADSLNNHFVDISICKYITYSKYNAMSGLKIEKKDILYTLRGSTIGKNALCNFNNGTVASSLMGIRISLKNKCFSTFLSYWLNSDNEYIQRDICINGSTAPNLSAENVKSFIIFLPPIEEQQQIADYLDQKCSAIDKSIGQKQSIIEKLKEYKKSLIYEVVTGKKEV